MKNTNYAAAPQQQQAWHHYQNNPATTIQTQSTAALYQSTYQKSSTSKNQKKVSSSKKSPKTQITSNHQNTLSASNVNNLLSQQQNFHHQRQMSYKNQSSVANLQNRQSSQNNTPDKSQKTGNQSLKKSSNNKHLKENSDNRQQQQYLIGVIEQRKRSMDYQPQYSKSTKVSPNRVPIPTSNLDAYNQQQQQLRLNNQINSNNPVTTFIENFQKNSQQFKIDNNYQMGNQCSLRIPLNEQAKNGQKLNNMTPNFDFDQISPNIISQTQIPHEMKGTNHHGFTTESQSLTFERNSIGGGSSGNNHNSIHQSFINLIYPSMSKKIMTNNQQLDSNSAETKQQQQYLNKKSGFNNMQHHPQQSNTGTHHQKSKSLFTGAQNFQNVHSHSNLSTLGGGANPVGVQKINQSSYKKQSNVFNYSHRLKELLDENSESQDIELQRRHQLFSQQPSPSNSQNNILLHMNDIEAATADKKLSAQKQSVKIKSTFEKIVMGQPAQMSCSIEDNISHVQIRSGLSNTPASQTIDLYLNNRQNQLSINTQNQFPLTKSISSVNTPNSNGIQYQQQQQQPQTTNQVNGKVKVEFQNGKGSQVRKPSVNGATFSQSHSIFNSNYIPEDSLQTHSYSQSDYSQLNTRRNSNGYKEDSLRSQPVQQQHNHNYQNQPIREKKQHQPTQSKISNTTKQNQQQNLPSQQQNQINYRPHHQRSSSDYVNFSQESNLNQQQQPQVKNYMNSDSRGFDMVSNNSSNLAIVNPHLAADYYEDQPDSLTKGVTPKDHFKDTDRGTNASFLQQYSQALMEAQIQINKQYQINNPIGYKNQHKQNKLSFVDNQQNVSQTISTTPADPKTIYHQRKLSHQPQGQIVVPSKIKSPEKNNAQFNYKDHYQKLALKRKVSPKPNTNHQLVHNTSRPQIQQQKQNFNPTMSGKSNVNSMKNSLVTSPTSTININHQNVSQQIQTLQNSFNHSQNKYQQMLTLAQHSASATLAGNHSQKTAREKDMKTKIIQQATKKYHNQQESQMHQNVHNKQSYSKLSSQNVTNNFKKTIQSEKVSPRIHHPNPALQAHHQAKKSIANISIDLYKGIVTQNQQNIAQPYSQPYMNQNGPQRQFSKISLQKSDSQQLQNDFIQRKNSFVIPNQHHHLESFRDMSPNNFGNIKFNQSSMTLNPPDHNLPNGHQQKHAGFQNHRYSVQNSPHKNIPLFQKNQKQSLHLKTSSMSNISSNLNGPLSNPYSQQQHHNNKPNNQSILSPTNKSLSFSNVPLSSNNKYPRGVDMSGTPGDPSFGEDDQSHVIYGGGMSKKNTQKVASKNNKQSKKPVQTSEFKHEHQPQTNHASTIREQIEYNKLSETEKLLNQIRNNILKQQKSKPGVMPFENDNIMEEEELQEEINGQLGRITENSVEQYPIETAIDLVGNSRRQTLYVKKDSNNTNSTHRGLTIQNPHEDGGFMYMTTDPNMSPYSKDISKLQKMITLNFKKFNEAPQTTSEFYRIGRVLGRGAFGKVNLAAHKVSEQLVAIKSINKEFLKSEEDQKKKIMQEFAILKQSNHQSVVRLYDTFETSKHICFVMELCSGGDLLTYVRKRRKLKEDVAKYFFKQIIDGLAYIHHSKLIVHRDIKLDNILLDANGRIKICDFGVSRQVSSETERMSEQCGTPAYIAPEILKDKGYEGFKVDVWSAGVCLYAMLIGTVPFKAASMHELHHLIISGKYEIKEEKLSESALNLISSLLEVDPKKRLSAYEVLSHPWLKDAVDEMDIFTQKEKDTIQKEYLSKNIDRVINRESKNQQQETEVIFTEHNLDTKTNGNSLLKNASTKSIILAPFNSTVSDFDEEKEKLIAWPEEVKQLMRPKKCIKFNPKVKDYDRQYEQNNNADLDNGVYNNFANDKSNKSESQASSSSQDSLKKSFKETELSSDDEKAEKQVEEARENKLKQQSELQEFEKQIKMKYVKYQEPVEVINEDMVSQIIRTGIYPKEYLLNCLNTKEMNYATATYHLLLKKQQIMLKLFSEDLNLKNNSQSNPFSSQ